jgi:hypothetical protein
MIRAIIFIAIGALGYHLYLNPGDKDVVIDKITTTINQGASKIQSLTQEDTADKIKDLVK